jgi:glycine dehydrogenase subunit 2
VVKGAIMIEPTETECVEVLDEFFDAMLAIAREAQENPDLLHQAPLKTRTRRFDETAAARNPRLKWEG